MLSKRQKEQFVLNLLGGTVGEIYAVTAVSVAAFFAVLAISRASGRPIAFPLDYVLNWVVLLAAITIYSSNIAILYVLVLIPAVLAIVWHQTSVSGRARGYKVTLVLCKKPFITAYRAQMLVITCLAILAVDFRIFPRRFAKVETWGTSLMDLGVGSFVFSMGLAHLRSILNLQGHSSGYVVTVYKGTRTAIPLLVLGIVRLVSVKFLNYQEHITEYGVHWNFFFTLGCLPILLALIDPILVLAPRSLVAAGISIVYEVALTKGGLQKWVLSEKYRYALLLHQNKEGLCSFIGYFSIFVFGQSFGSFIMAALPNPYNLLCFPGAMIPRRQLRFAKLLTVLTTTGLFIVSVVYTMIFEWARQSTVFSRPSRRLANLLYVLWTVLYNAVLLLGYNLVGELIPTQYVSENLEAINLNGLFVFLLANVLTGCINLCFDTLSMNPGASFALLLVYALCLAWISKELHRRKIYLTL